MVCFHKALVCMKISRMTPSPRCQYPEGSDVTTHFALLLALLLTIADSLEISSYFVLVLCFKDLTLTNIAFS